MQVDRFLRDPVSRRRFFAMSGVSIAGGSAAFLAACGSNANEQEQGVAGDVAILSSALELEFTAIAAYEASAPFLKGEAKELGERIRSQEEEHAAALTRAIKDLGEVPVRPKQTYDFPSLRNQKGALTFANELENKAVAAYVDAVSRLSSAGLRRTIYGIVASEAEHISVLLGQLKKPPVPAAFVTGQQS